MRDHGGNIDRAMAAHGGAAKDWIDLSTGINRVPYPLPPIPSGAWTGLPTRAEMASLARAAQVAYATAAPILPVAGAQAAIQMIPRLSPPGRARVLSPTYNEHAGALSAAGWRVEPVAAFGDLAGADLAVVVNPNNPDGRPSAPGELLDLLPKVGRLVVDESFCDPRPDLSVAAEAGRDGLIVLRSFGKFYGLAGVRLGFVLGSGADITMLAAIAGPWPISGAAIEVGRVALADRAWHGATTARLQDECGRIDRIVAGAGWTLVGGTGLFRLYDTPRAQAAQDRLARHHIWSRVFPWSDRWLRLGLPGSPVEWDRLAAVLA